MVREAIRAVLNPPPRPQFHVQHTPPPSFRRGDRLLIEATFPREKVQSIYLRYRRINQEEIWRTEQMVARDQRSAYSANIPADYTDSPFPLQYYFELCTDSGAVSLYPGLGPSLTTQPYFVVRRA